jgi:tripartite-type tricarboxylate transporter receptor subunit TctC
MAAATAPAPGEQPMKAAFHAIRTAFVLAVAVLVWPAVCAAQDWPAKPVKITVAFGPGGTADVLARLLAAELSSALGQQFYVENRPGNAGAIGSAQVVRAEPDGYTLLIGGAGPHLTGPAINPNIGYETMRDFTHIAMIAGDSFMLAASTSLGVKSFADLVKLARDKPVNCGSPGAGSQGHLVQLLINRAVGIKLQPVPYRSAAEAMTDLVGNHIALALQPAISVGEQVRAGKAVGLAVTSLERNPVYPDFPTFKELGYADVRGVAWFWLTGPKGIPSPIVEKLNAAVRRIIASPKIKAQFARNALSTLDLDVAGLNKFLGEEVALWGALAKEVGLKVQ